MSTALARPSRKSTRDSVQTELDELQRQYRTMELSRKHYNEDSINTLRTQRQQIDKLKKDNDRLKEDLALETRQAKQANNMSASAQISKLQDQGDMYTRKIEIEKRRIEELDKQINKMQSAILVQRKEMGGVNASRENNQQVQKQIRILENRLDKALVKFNEALAHNKQLRETIDNLRRERVKKKIIVFILIFYYLYLFQCIY
jgi:chromosome segregation ATPase